MTLFNPYHYGIPVHSGYDMKKLKNRFRDFEILYNRDGAAPVKKGMKFIGEVGVFEELPPAKNMNNEIYNLISNINK